MPDADADDCWLRAVDEPRLRAALTSDGGGNENGNVDPYERLDSSDVESEDGAANVPASIVVARPLDDVPPLAAADKDHEWSVQVRLGLGEDELPVKLPPTIRRASSASPTGPYGDPWTCTFGLRVRLDDQCGGTMSPNASGVPPRNLPLGCNDGWSASVGKKDGYINVRIMHDGRPVLESVPVHEELRCRRATTSRRYGAPGLVVLGYVWNHFDFKLTGVTLSVVSGEEDVREEADGDEDVMEVDDNGTQQPQYELHFQFHATFNPNVGIPEDNIVPLLRDLLKRRFHFPHAHLATVDMGLIFREVMPDKRNIGAQPSTSSSAPMSHGGRTLVNRDKLEWIHSKFPELYPFQCRTVAFMLEREGVGIHGDRYVPGWAWHEATGTWVDFLKSRVSIGRVPPVEESIKENWDHFGGILAEEMGLGKTVEILALIRANRRPAISHTVTPILIDPKDPSAGTVLASGATLIVSPMSIVYQWATEIDYHTPALRYFMYEGVDKMGAETAETLAQYDVILTTYDVLRKELHMARGDNMRSRRFERKMKRKTTPLIEIEWWRVCMDEAQMVENVNAATAEMAQRLHRVNSWAVTGTPVGNTASTTKDLYGLFTFLKLADEYQAVADVHPDSELAFIKRYMIRNSKASVRDELHLPAQRENLVMVEFSEIEREFYARVRAAVMRDFKAVMEGREVQQVRGYQRTVTFGGCLLHLRQTCVHPQIGEHNQRQLGTVFLSIPEVLNVMLQQSIALVQNGRRHLINIEVDRALLYEILKEYKYSEEVYRKKIEELEEGIDLLRKEVADAKLDVERLESAAKDRAEVAAANVVTGSSSTSADTTDATTDQSRNEKEQIALDRAKDLLRTRNSRLTSWTKLYHRVLFCLACLQSELKDEAGSEATFKRAEAVRKELMVPAEEQVSEGLANMKEVLAKANIDKFVQGAEQGTNEYWRVSLDRRITGGIMSAHVISDANRCAAFLNEQVADLLQCRKRVYEIIQLPLQDLDYSTDAAVQERGHLYQDIYEYAVFMRKTAVTGVTDLLSNDRRSAIEGKLRHKTAVTKSTSRVAVILEKSGGGERPDDDAVDSNSASAPDAVDEHRHTELLKEKPRLPAILPSSFRSLKHCMLDLKALSTRAETSSAERNICRMKYDELREVQEKQLELLAYLEKETAELGKLWNRRVQFYRTLQRLSDDVALPQVWSIDRMLVENRTEANKIYRTIAAEEPRVRYLKNLVEETAAKRNEDSCAICGEEFSNTDTVVVAQCGHFSCFDCLEQWMKIKKNCPTCKHPVDMKNVQRVVKQHTASPNARQAIHDQAAGIALDGAHSSTQFFPPAYRLPRIRGGHSSKITTVVQHIKYLADLHPTFKCIVFSQWEDVLTRVIKALAENGIESLRLSSTHGAKQRAMAPVEFKNNPAIRVFCLNARSQAAGLTLVAATHIFIVDPCTNPAIEAQACGRVHRLGQKNVTWVHRYIVAGTIEENVYALNASRRLAARAHDEEDAARGDGAVDSFTIEPKTLKSQFSYGGEVVEESDLKMMLLDEMERAGYALDQRLVVRAQGGVVADAPRDEAQPPAVALPVRRPPGDAGRQEGAIAQQPNQVEAAIVAQQPRAQQGEAERARISAALNQTIFRLPRIPDEPVVRQSVAALAPTVLASVSDVARSADSVQAPNSSSSTAPAAPVSNRISAILTAAVSNVPLGVDDSASNSTVPTTRAENTPSSSSAAPASVPTVFAPASRKRKNDAPVRFRNQDTHDENNRQQ